MLTLSMTSAAPTYVTCLRYTKQAPLPQPSGSEAKCASNSLPSKRNIRAVAPINWRVFNLFTQYTRMANAAAVETFGSFSQREALPDLLKNAKAVAALSRITETQQAAGRFLPLYQCRVNLRFEPRWHTLDSLVWARFLAKPG